MAVVVIVEVEDLAVELETDMVTEVAEEATETGMGETGVEDTEEAVTVTEEAEEDLIG